VLKPDNTSKTFLISGSAGFIGSHLCDRLLAQGHLVIGVDNYNDFYDPRIKENNAKAHIQKDNFKFYKGDLCDYKFLQNIFDKDNISHVVHIAAVAGVRPSVQNPILYQKNNGESTINLLDLSAKYKISKFIFASSSSVYGSRSKVPFVETEDISKPISPYAATKVAGEAMVHAMSHLHKIPSIALRFFTVYGPRQRPDLSIHKFSKLIYEEQELPIYGDGSAKRDFTYIDDIIDGVLKSIDYKGFSPGSFFDVFNLGESRTTEVRALVKLLEERIGRKAKIKYHDPIPGDVPITYADISKAKSKLEYDPSTDLEEGLDKFIAWFKSYYAGR
jgi:UDP-glucuronate 4-epimerase